MSVAERLNKMNRQAQQWLDYVEGARLVKDLEEGPLSEEKLNVAIDQRAVSFNPEGLETFPKGREKVDLPGLALPASEVGWDRANGVYRIFVRTSGPAVLNARRPSGGTLFKNRKTSGLVVVDVDSGRVRLKSEGAPITEVRLSRHSGRADGSITIGPFAANGRVSARAIGYGDWKTQVAVDYEVGASISEGRLEMWPGSGAGEPGIQGSSWQVFGLPDQREKEPIAWHVARQFRGGRSLSAPSFAQEVSVGKVYLSSKVAQKQSFSLSSDDPSDFWCGLGDPWAGSDEIGAPLFDESFGYWAFVWGRAVGPSVVKVIDTETGAPVSKEVLASREGMYLVKAQAPSPSQIEIDVEGTLGRFGEPMRLARDPIVLAHNNGVPYIEESPGKVHLPARLERTVRRLPYSLSPSQFVVKAEGRGLLKAIEITVEDNSHSPLAKPERKVYREELSKYKDPESVWSSQGKRPRPRANAGVLAVN